MKRRWWQMVASLALLLALAWAVPAQAPRTVQAQDVEDQPDSGTPLRTLTASGTGQATAQPDLAIVVLGVEVLAEEASTALSENNTRMQAVIDALKAEGVAAADIQTQAIRLSPRYDQVEPREPGAQQEGTRELVGFVAINIAEVRVRDLENLGLLLDTAVEAGSNQIQGIRFEVEDAVEVYDEARQAAWANAMHKAEQLAGLAKAELGPVLTINESSRTPFPAVERAALARGGSGVPVEAGSQLVEVDLQITWTLSDLMEGTDDGTDSS